jgi:hypothetical protein
VATPCADDLQELVEQIAARVGQVLERRGLIERDIENAWLSPGSEPGPLDDLLGHSITYRIAVGPRAGQKLLTLQTVAPRLQGLEGDPNGAARAWPANAWRWRNRARLATLVPPPRMHLTRFHGVFAPNSRLRAAVTPAHRGRGAAKQPPVDPAKPARPRYVAMNWARRLKRVFGVEIDSCVRCGGKLKIIASIEEP